MFPSDDARCGWYAALPAPASARKIRGEERAAWAVIGAGVTGLAAARRLAEQQTSERILLVEAQRVGFGASGRNSGFVTDVGHYAPRLGREHRSARVRLSRAGIAALRKQVDRHDIACDWNESGRLHGAVGAAGMRALERFLRQLDEIGEPYEELSAQQLESLTGTSYYRAGARLPGSALVQPAALVRGLAEALPSNVELFEESPVRAIHNGETLRLTCAEGSIEAERVLLATNAFTPALGFLRRRLLPMHVFASLTRVLSETEQASLGGQRHWGLVPEVAVGATVRRTPDQRILIRNSVCYTPTGGLPSGRLERVRAAHRTSLRSRFPALANVELEHTWSGVVAISLNDVPFFGRPAPNVYGAAIFNGIGMAMGTAAGSLLADLALDTDSDLLRELESLPGPTWLPPAPLVGWGVRSVLAWMHYQGRAEL